MKEPVEIVYLPTEDKSNIAKIREDIVYWENPDKYYKSRTLDGSHYRDAIFQHTYTTVSQDVEEIRKGDWGICSPLDFKGEHPILFYNNGTNEAKFKALVKGSRKIIATTDPKLKLNCSCLGMQDKVKCDWMCKTHKDYMLPQVQQSFLKEFVANPNGVWEVEYEVDMVNASKPDNFVLYKLKLNQDNEVTITSVEEKMYSLSDMKLSFKAGGAYSQSYTEKHGYMESKSFTNWIKENL